MSLKRALVDQGRSVDRVAATHGDWYPVRLTPAADPTGGTGEGDTATLLYLAGGLDLDVEHHVEVDSASYGGVTRWSLAGDPSPLRKRKKLLGWEANLTRVVDKLLTVTREVTFVDGLPNVASPNDTTLYVEVHANPASEDDPRTGPGRVQLRWYDAERHGLNPQPGWRLRDPDTDEEYEIVTAPTLIRTGTAPWIWEADAVKLASLYPFTADVEARGGVVVTKNVPLNLRRGEIVDTDRGEYADYTAETSIEWLELFSEENVFVRVGEHRYRVRNVVPHEVMAWMELRLRRAS